MERRLREGRCTTKISLKEKCAKWRQKCGDFFFVSEGEKRVAHVWRWLLVAGGVVVVGAGFALVSIIREDTSLLARSDRPLAGGASASSGSLPGATATGKVNMMFKNSEANGRDTSTRNAPARGVKVNYKAQQVLVSDSADPARTLPMGTNLIGKTLTTIDTRAADQVVKVLLPYGGRASAGGELPKNTTLFGQVTYDGKGEKVFVKFTKGLLPSGQEFAVEAQALNPGDYSPGLAGHFHGNADTRVASSLGLTMIAGMSDVLTEKESLGGGGFLPGSVTPKSTMRNAIMHGVSQVAQDEATRQAEAIGQEPQYVTVDAGTDLIVSLTKAFTAN